MRTSKNGFTLIELLVAITIVGILATTVSFTFNGLIGRKRSESDVLAFHGMLKSLRARALADDCPYLVHIDPSADRFAVFRDSTAGLDTNSAENITSSVIDLPDSALEFDHVKPDFNKIPFAGYNTGKAIQGEWNLDNSATPNTNNLIVYSNDAISSINSGLLFINNKERDGEGYAIIKPEGEQDIKLFRWDGQSWYQM